MIIGKTVETELEVLSPLHINSGRGDLLDDYDFVSAGEEICIIDIERLLSDVPVARWAGKITAARISQLVKPELYSSYARYSLLKPAGIAHISRMMECVKDVRDRLYLPGSSIKGAVRTALARAMVVEEKIGIDERDVGYNPRYADAPLMARLFGADPNHDIMRSLQVPDTRPLGTENIELTPVSLYTMGRDEPRRLVQKGQGFRFNLEAIRPGSRIAGTIRLDEFLLKGREAGQLGFGKRTHYVENFARCSNSLAEAIIGKEIAFFGRFGVPEVEHFYRRLSSMMDGLDKDRDCLLQMSWGTGWTSKTVGTALGDDLIKYIRGRFRLDRGRQGEPVFPKTRRLVERGGSPVSVMGWVKMSL